MLGPRSFTLALSVAAFFGQVVSGIPVEGDRARSSTILNSASAAASSTQPAKSSIKAVDLTVSTSIISSKTSTISLSSSGSSSKSSTSLAAVQTTSSSIKKSTSSSARTSSSSTKASIAGLQTSVKTSTKSSTPSSITLSSVPIITTSSVKTSGSIIAISTNSTKVASTSTPANPVAAIETILTALGASIITGEVAALEVLGELEKIVPTVTPTTVPQATSILSSIIASATAKGNVSLFELSAQYLLNGLAPQNVATIIAAYSLADNSDMNNNTEVPANVTVYPKKSSQDAPYSLTESQLRGAIHIPSTFTFGKVPPLVLVHGTGGEGGSTFEGNLIKLFTGSSIADPVWLNIPNAELPDMQVNAEYVAYTLNYISAISNNVNVSAISWSQGAPITQWALKYWPSTRSIVSDFIPISGDFHGTLFADIICPNGIPCNPSVYQQEYNSNFIAALRANGGDSAYVPTTALYSGVYDEIVEPQQGTGASGFMNDARNIGVSNNDVEITCAGYVAGTFNTHESMLANSFTYHMIVDALTHSGPGLASRLSLPTVCGTYLAPGLDLDDFLLTENTIPIAGVLLLLMPGGTVTTEPPLMSYALSS